MSFKRSDFVQVQHHVMDEDLVTQSYWRNALYVGKSGDGHIVQYCNGEKQAVHSRIVIKKVIPNE